MKKHKNLILIIFLIVQVLFLLITGSNTTDGGEEARQACLEIITYEYPKEMYTSRGYDLSLQDENDLLTSIIMEVTSVLHIIIALVCVSIPIRSIKEQAKSSQSTQFLANQRRITSGILYFMVVEIVGLGIPFILIDACFLLSVGNTVISHCCYIAMCIYPIFGPYYVLMSNKDYRNKVKEILRKAQELGSRSPTI